MQLFMRDDQRLMNAGKWDYKDQTLLPNQIKNSIEKSGISRLDQKEKKWISDILWQWYHHAISCALWRYGDQNAALSYSEKALELQPKEHPNRITRLLYLLIRNRLPEAESWAATIEDGPEKATAQHFLTLYREGRFFETQI